MIPPSSASRLASAVPSNEPPRPADKPPTAPASWAAEPPNGVHRPRRLISRNGSGTFPKRSPTSREDRRCPLAFCERSFIDP